MSILGYTVFSDDFNRADSGTVGNGWSELDPAAILSNQLHLGDAGNNNVGVYRNITAVGVMPYEMQGTFNISGGTRVHYFSPYFSTVSFTGLFFRVFLGTTNNVSMYDGAFGGGGTNLGTTSFTLASATKYWFWADLTPNGTNFDFNLYITTTSTKPGSPMLTATNFTPSQPTGTYVTAIIDANNGNTCDIDFITVLNSNPSIVDTNVNTDLQSYAIGMSKSDTNVTNDLETLKYGFTNDSKSSSSIWTNNKKS